jgi:hypothetical protein
VRSERSGRQQVVCSDSAFLMLRSGRRDPRRPAATRRSCRRSRLVLREIPEPGETLLSERGPSPVTANPRSCGAFEASRSPCASRNLIRIGQKTALIKGLQGELSVRTGRQAAARRAQERRADDRDRLGAGSRPARPRGVAGGWGDGARALVRRHRRNIRPGNRGGSDGDAQTRTTSRKAGSESAG